MANKAYGQNGPGVSVFPAPIIRTVAPTSSNKGYPLGQQWVDTAGQAVYQLVAFSGGLAVWTAAPASGAELLTALEVDPGDIDITSGDLNVAAGDINVTVGSVVIGAALSVGTTSTFVGAATFGDVTINGDLDVASLALTDLTSSLDADPAMSFTADGGTSATILTVNTLGTAADSIKLRSDAGGMTFTTIAASKDITALATLGSVNLTSGEVIANSMVLTSAGGLDMTVAGTGGLDIDMVNTSGSININAGQVANDAMVLTSAGGLDITVAGTGARDVDLVNTSGSINITAGEAVGNAIVITASDAAGGVDIASGTGGISAEATGGNVTITAGTGANGTVAISSTGTGDITIDSDDTLLLDSDGVLELNSSAGVIGIGNDADANNINIGTGAADRVITIGNVTGASQVVLNSGTAGVAINTTGAGDFAVTSADTVLIDAAGVLELNSSAGVIGIGNDAVAQNINIGTGAADRVVTIGNVTGASQVVLNSGTAGVAINTTGAGDFAVTSADTVLIDAAGVLELNSSAGVIGIGNDAVAQNINIGTGAAARVVTIGNVTGASQVVINSGTAGVAINTTGAGDFAVTSADTVLIDAAGVLELNSSAGVIGIGNDAVAQNINMGTGAAARTITIGNVTGATALALNSGTGHITLTSTGTGDIILNSDDTMLLDADGVLELNSSAGVISIGNDADAQGINIGTAGVRPILIGNASAGTTVTLNSPDNVGVTLQNSVRLITGVDTPNGNVTAPAGSLYLQTNPAGATSRLYINTDSAMTWTNITCAA